MQYDLTAYFYVHISYLRSPIFIGKDNFYADKLAYFELSYQNSIFEILFQLLLAQIILANILV